MSGEEVKLTEEEKAEEKEALEEFNRLRKQSVEVR